MTTSRTDRADEVMDGSGTHFDRHPNCEERYPKGDLVCHKPMGHEGPHTVLLGIHPEQEDGYGLLWPAQEEWDEWTT